MLMISLISTFFYYTQTINNPKNFKILKIINLHNLLLTKCIKNLDPTMIKGREVVIFWSFLSTFDGSWPDLYCRCLLFFSLKFLWLIYYRIYPIVSLPYNLLDFLSLSWSQYYKSYFALKRQRFNYVKRLSYLFPDFIS